MVKDVSKVYRLRGFSTATLKELSYGEIYFSSLRELNDPYDTKAFYRFTKDQGKYARLIQDVASGIRLDLPVEIAKKLAKLLAAHTLSYEELIQTVESDDFRFLMIAELITSNLPDPLFAGESLIRALKFEIHKRVGKFSYVVSFTKSISNPVIWSLYADEHRGYAVEMTPVHNRIRMNPVMRSVKAVSADGKASYQEGDEYPLQKVRYVTRIQPLDGFLSFNGQIYGKTVRKKYVESYWKKYRQVPLLKYRKWQNEKEYRLVDQSDWFTTQITNDGPVERWKMDRIFHYDQTQLTGITFGMRMSPKERSEITHSILEMRRRLVMQTGGCLPVLLFREAVQVHSHYQLKILPIKGLDYKNHEFEPIQQPAKEVEFKQMIEIAEKFGQNVGQDYAIYQK